MRTRAPRDVVVRRGEVGGGATGSRVFDPSDGLDESETVAVALALNPGLRAKRLAVGEARAELITAGLWPNPEAGVSWMAGIGGASGYSVDGDVLFELLRPGERRASRAAAAAGIDVARSEVIADEYETVAKVRTQRLNVLAAEQAAAILADEAKLREAAVDLLRRQARMGEAGALDLAATELEAAEVRRDARKAAAALASERLELNRLLGLPPEYDLKLAESGKPLAFTIYDDLSDADIDERILKNRPDVRVAEAGYRQAEEELRLAVLQQYPRLALGPAYERELEGDRALGIGLSLELPIFDRNQGGIAAKQSQLLCLDPTREPSS